MINPTSSFVEASLIMAAKEEVNEGEMPSINKSSFDVEKFCQRHLVCRQCNEIYTDPVTLPCLHTYCSKCLIARADERRKREKENSAAAGQGEGDSLTLSIARSYIMIPEKKRKGPGAKKGQRESGGGLENSREQQGERQVNGRENGEGESDEEGASLEVEESHIVVYGNEDLSCPHDCDAGVQIGDDVQQLVNRPLSNIIQAAKLKEKLPQGEIKCGNCEVNTAYWICNDPKCGNMPLCERCYEQHGIDKRSKHHQVVKIDPEKDCWRILNRHTWYCSKHPDYLVDMYCPHHDKVICHKCCTIDHHSSKCKVKDVDEFYTNTFDERLERVRNVEELNDRFKAALHIGETIKRSLDTKRDNAIKVVNDRYQHLIDQLTNERDEVIAKANSICDLKKKEIDDHQETLKRVTETLEESLSFVKDYSEIANPTEFMFLKTQLNQRLDDLHEHYSKFNLSPADDDELTLKLSKKETLPPIGEVSSTPCVKNFTAVTQPQTMNTITVECRDIAGHRVSLKPLPELKAFVTTHNESVADGIKCDVKPDRTNGRYIITVPQIHACEYQIHIYEPKKYPHKQYYIKGGPIQVPDRDSA